MRVRFFVTQKGYKIKCDYFHLLTHSGGAWVSSEICINSSCTKALSGSSCKLVPEAIIWFMHNSIESICTFTPDKVCCHFWSSCCSPGWSGYVLSSGTACSLIVSFGFIPIINDIVEFILFTTLSKFLTQIVDTFSGSWSSWVSINLNNSFANSLLKASTKAVWVCLYFVVALQISTLCFSRNFATSFFQLRPVITLKYLPIFKHATLFIDCFRHKCNFAGYFGPKEPSDFNATLMPVKIFLYVFPSKTLWGI